ncbi:hypothetical protein PITCH_A1260015 [uncultured Desulfobacterium sp.]|uniref:Fis family transcriptional regulator n=1 Tax=uncultured Desulfobacterium sp. TaxID=201089 RepID=A0A445MRZ7_9BACT|nr:hypothetical protein PITCH_A1260015 [uncultured Desulfobacterium sp.]
MEVEAVNTVKAGLGDWVVVYFESSKLFKLSFFLYVFPVIIMIVGALIGERMAENFQGNPSSYSAFFGFFFFFGAMAVVKLMDKRARKSGKYRPEIIRVKKKAGIGDPELPPAPCQSVSGE